MNFFRPYLEKLDFSDLTPSEINLLMLNIVSGSNPLFISDCIHAKTLRDLFFKSSDNIIFYDVFYQEGWKKKEFIEFLLMCPDFSQVKIQKGLKYLNI